LEVSKFRAEGAKISRKCQALRRHGSTSLTREPVSAVI
jgi:hypothetical protein